MGLKPIGLITTTVFVPVLVLRALFSLSAVSLAVPSYEESANLAHQFWEEGSRPEGSEDEDGFAPCCALGRGPNSQQVSLAR
jgi:hypothetical protein